MDWQMILQASDVPTIEKRLGYPTAIPPDTKPDTAQDSKSVIIPKKGEDEGSKGCMTSWSWWYWPEPQKIGDDVYGYAYTYAATTCWQNPITRVTAKVKLWKWVDNDWVMVARDDVSRNYAGQADAQPIYENAESGYYIQTSYHYAKQGVWPLLEEWEESDYVWLNF
jgi:hypothetical protein